VICVSQERAARKRQRLAARAVPFVADGDNMATLLEALILNDALPGGEPRHCRKCRAFLWAVATRCEYVALEAHDTHQHFDDGTHLVGRSEPIIRRGRVGDLKIPCPECGTMNRGYKRR